MEEYKIGRLGTIRITPEVVFNEGIRLLGEECSLISLGDLGFSRIFSAEDARNYLHLNGAYVHESVILHKGDSPIFFSDSLLLNSAYFLEQAVKAHSQKTEFLIEENFYSRVKKRAIAEQNKPIEERNAFVFKGEQAYEDREGNYFIPADKLKEVEITRWFYKDVSGDYGKLLQESGVEKMPVWFPKKEYISGIEQPFLRQVWVCCFKEHKKEELIVRGNSGISANNRSLHETSRLIGIVKNG